MTSSIHPAFDKVHRFYDSNMRLFGLYKGKLVARMLDLDGSEIVLDAGGGTGWVAKHLIQFAREVYVLDESEKMLSRARRYKQLHLIRGDVTRTCFLDASFDAVLLSDVLHHVAEHTRLIDEVHRILKPWGKLLVYEYDIAHPETRIFRWFESKLFDKVYFRERSMIQEEISAKGFESVVKCSRAFWYIDLWKKRG